MRLLASFSAATLLIGAFAASAAAQERPAKTDRPEKPEKADKPAAPAGAKPLLIRASRIETGSRGTIFDGAILIKDGRIAAVGTQVQAPADAEVLDVKDGVLMPALVVPSSRFSVAGGGGGAPHMRVTDDWVAGHPMHRRARESGVGALGLQGAGGGAVGVVSLAAGPSGSGVLSPEAAVVFRFALGGEGKTGLTSLLQSATKALEESEKKEKEKKAEVKKAAATPAIGPGPSPAPAPEKADGETLEERRARPLVRLAKGEIPVWILVDDSAAIAHLEAVLDTVTGKKFRFVIQGGPDLADAAEILARRKLPVVLPTAFGTVPYGRVITNPAAKLAKAGVEIALLPPGDGASGFESWRDALAQLVRGGLSREVALRACTVGPATLLGVEAEVGAIEEKRRADVVWLSGDPLEPTTAVRRVWLGGEVAYAAP